MLMALDLGKIYTAVLNNTYQVSYEKIEDKIGSSGFTIPLDDPKNEFIAEMQWVELTDNEDEYVGLYRVMPTTVKRDVNSSQIHYSTTETLCTLGDTVLFGCHEIKNKTTREVIQFLLNKQKTKHWVLKKCDFSRKLTYKWENKSGLVEFLFSIPTDFGEEYPWQWDTEAYPFELSLVKLLTEAVARIQEGYNMQRFEIEHNPEILVSRIYPLGSSEGVSKVNIRSVNQGVPYLENRAAINRYDLLESAWVKQRLSDPRALKENTLRMLEEWTKPQVSRVVTAVDLIKLADRPLAIGRLRLGTVIMTNTNEFGSVNLRIKKESKKDVFSTPQDIQLELRDLREAIHSTMTAFNRRQGISETYARGAATLLNRSIQGELNKAQSAELNLYFDEDTLYVNTTELIFKATAKGPSHSVTNIDLIVDGKELPQLSLQRQRLNILSYLRETTDGEIERGNHTFQFFSHQPLWLDASVIHCVYIQSQLGGQF